MRIHHSLEQYRRHLHASQIQRSKLTLRSFDLCSFSNWFVVKKIVYNWWLISVKFRVFNGVLVSLVSLSVHGDHCRLRLHALCISAVTTIHYHTCVSLLIADQQSTCSSGLTYSLSYCELQISSLFVEQTFFLNTIANDMSIHRV